MRQKLKYFIFNKVRDYEGGCMSHMRYDCEGIWADASAPGGRSGFISQILDSREADTPWHRLTFETIGGTGTPYRVTVFAADSLVLPGGEMDAVALLEEESLSFEEKLERMECFVKKRVSGFSDLLLFEVRGRYLWIAVEIYAQGSPPPKLGGFQIYFPRQSWMRYLPEVYQASDRDQFLERYLAVFQTLYETMNDRIRGIPGLLDVDRTQGEYLVWLAGWLDIAGSQMWNTSQLRQLLRQAVELYRMRGTREGIRRMIRLYTGGEARIVEHHQLDPYRRDENSRQALTRLYGSSADQISIVMEKTYVPDQETYHALLRVIEEMKPAQIEVDLVILEPYMYLGGHTYMGINSAFGAYRDVKLDGLSMVSFSALGESGYTRGTQQDLPPVL